MSDETRIGYNAFAGYEGNNFTIEAPRDQSIECRHLGSVRVVIQRADIPDLLRSIMGGEDYERTVAPRLLANLKAIREGQEHAAEPATWVASGCAGGPPAGLASPAAIEMAGALPTRAGALHDALLSAEARRAGIRSASIDSGAPAAAVDFSRFDPRTDRNRGGTCSCGHGATAHADLRDGVSRCGDCGCHLFVADHAGLTSSEMRAVNAARKAPLVAEMEAALGHGNQDPPPDPAALLRAAIAQQVRRSACDPAGLLTLAQALEAVNRAAPTGANALAKVEALRDKWRDGTEWHPAPTVRKECADALTAALRGEDPSDG